MSYTIVLIGKRQNVTKSECSNIEMPLKMIISISKPRNFERQKKLSNDTS